MQERKLDDKIVAFRNLKNIYFTKRDQNTIDALSEIKEDE